MKKNDYKPTWADVLLCIFVTLKLTDNIDWSWWWVTAPLWGGISFTVLCVFIATLVTNKE